MTATSTKRERSFYNKTFIQHYIIGICHSGEGTIELNGVLYVQKDQDSLLVLPDSTIRIISTSSDFKGVYVMIKKDIVNPIAKMRNSFQYIHIYNNPLLSLMPNQFDILKSYIFLVSEALKSENRKSSKSLSLSFLVDSFQLRAGEMYIEEKFVFLNKQAAQPHFIVFEEFLMAIKKEHYKNRSVKYYANKFNMSRRYFSRVIKNVSSQTPKEWINSEVLHSLKELLLRSDLPIGEIAEELNFSSLSALNEFFKKEMGMSPSEYRNSDLNTLSFENRIFDKSEQIIEL